MTRSLNVRHLTKHYHHTSILTNLHFHVKEGEVLSIVGPSGSGKTTLLRLLAGLEQPTSGTIQIGGEDVTQLKANKRPISLVFQQPLLFPHMTIEENIHYGRKLAGNTHLAKTGDLLEAIGLTAFRDHYPAEISGGQQQRVSLARALATEPSILLLDEPFSHLDRQLRQELRLWVKEFLDERNITAIFVTHDIEEAMFLGDRVALFHEGDFQQIGHPHQLYESPANPFAAKFLGGHLIIDEQHYIPLKACRFSPPDEDAIHYTALWQHTFYQHGQTIGHFFVQKLSTFVSLPVHGEWAEKEVIDLYFARSAIRPFT